MLNNRGIAVKLSVMILLPSLLILCMVISYNFVVSRRLIINLAKENSRHLGNEVSNYIAAELKPVEKTVRNIAIALEDVSLSYDEMITLSRKIVENNANVFGVAIAFEPFTVSPGQLFFAPYCYRDGDRIVSTHLGGPNYVYFNMDWYQLPRELQRTVWTEPYVDTGGGNMLMTTCAAPFYKNINGRQCFAGVVTADISLAWLQKKCSDIQLYDSGYAVLVSGRGTFLYHPDSELVLNETVFTIAEERNDPSLWDLGREMIDGKSGLVLRSNWGDNRLSYFLYMPLNIGKWSLGFYFPETEVLREVRVLTRDILLMAACGGLLLIAAIVIVSRTITRPIKRLSDTALAVAEGQLDTRLPDNGATDEVGLLTRSFRHMQDALKLHIRNLTETTAAKERIESELRIARDIQMGILPKLFPPFPEREEFDIFAYIAPAKEVSGDFYDFFFVDENHFCFLIADVSGKGVPAAFFMAVSKTLVKAVAGIERDPGVILEKVNNDLAEDNDACMFVTVFLAMLDIRTGALSYASAGHNPPIYISKDGPKPLQLFNEPMAGAMTDMTYTTGNICLEPNEVLLLYTDGVTEAMDAGGAPYSDARLLETLESVPIDSDKPLPAETLVKTIARSVDQFVKGAEQSDDITMLALRFIGPCK